MTCLPENSIILFMPVAKPIIKFPSVLEGSFLTRGPHLPLLRAFILEDSQ